MSRGLWVFYIVNALFWFFVLLCAHPGIAFAYLFLYTPFKLVKIHAEETALNYRGPGSYTIDGRIISG